MRYFPSKYLTKLIIVPIRDNVRRRKSVGEQQQKEANDAAMTIREKILGNQLSREPVCGNVLKLTTSIWQLEGGGSCK